MSSPRARSRNSARAVEPGHHHVEEDHVGPLGPRLVEARRAVGSLEHLHALRLEVDPAQEPDRRLVVDYENLRHPMSAAPPLYPPRENVTPPCSPGARGRAGARTR